MRTRNSFFLTDLMIVIGLEIWVACTGDIM